LVIKTGERGEHSTVRPVLCDPSYIQEFREITSNYEIENKEDSAEISSSGEFENADRMKVYLDDDTAVL